MSFGNSIDWVSIVFTVVCAAFGTVCTGLFLKNIKDHQSKALQQITFTLLFFTFSAFSIVIKNIFIIKEGLFNYHFTIYDSFSYAFHMLGNIFLLLFIRNLYIRPFSKFDKLVLIIEGILPFLVVFSFFYPIFISILLLIHICNCLYIYGGLIYETNKCWALFFRNRNLTPKIAIPLRYIKLSGICILLSIIIFTFTEIIVEVSPQSRWIFGIGWIFSTIFGIFVYKGFISPDLNQQLYNTTSPEISVFAQISYLKSTINKLEEEIENRRKLEDLLRKSTEEANQANQAKSDFLTNMSHELRTPLNSIIGFSDLLLLDQNAHYSEEQNEMLAIIHESGQILLRMIDNILDLSKIESGQNQCEISSIDFQRFITELSHIFAFKLQTKKLRFIIDNPQKIQSFFADENKIRQIFINLIDNAIKFSKPQKSIILHIESIPDAIKFRFQDFGIGIKPEILSTIFKPFTQIKNVFTKDAQGLGLGLYYTKKLIELHKGNIEITSQIDHGTEITIIFPQSLKK
jgi:signal transduction histidine kinase